MSEQYIPKEKININVKKSTMLSCAPNSLVHAANLLSALRIRKEELGRVPGSRDQTSMQMSLEKSNKIGKLVLESISL